MPLLTQCPPWHGGVTPSLSNLKTSREHLPASILIGQCCRYQPLNLLPCLVIIILLTVIVYGLTHSHQHSYPGTVPALVCPQPLGFLLFFSTIGSYPQPIPSIMVFSGSSQSLGHLSTALTSLRFTGDLSILVVMGCVDFAGLDHLFPTIFFPAQVWVSVAVRDILQKI